MIFKYQLIAGQKCFHRFVNKKIGNNNKTHVRSDPEHGTYKDSVPGKVKKITIHTTGGTPSAAAI